MTTANGKPTSATPTTPVGDLTKVLTDAAHVVIGFGVLGWNKVQVRRRELTKSLDSQLDGAKEQFSTAVRNLDTRLAPVRKDLESRLDKVGERLPGQAREVLSTARNIARDTEHQVRQAVGAL